ncbi:MAG TPA: segregation/condensation protein A [Rhodospirillaceae bacterium]|nr:segregation/condensation protein A [Candidatus Neomarinimicrobiota bacterium]HCX13838.1 segregation/condensation protein A [Rhodospirillaceae bacterium]
MPSDQIEKSLINFEEDDRTLDRSAVDPMSELVLNLSGFEGPIDVLLTLARDQKVDLMHISILALAQQYLKFIDTTREFRLEIAADYLVMAAWLAFLKSKLLLPKEEESDEPSAAEMAEALKFQLLRLEAMQAAGRKLFELPRRGIGFFPRGMPDGLPVSYHAVYDVSLYDLLRAYANQHHKKNITALEIEPFDLYSIDDAVQRLREILPGVPDWTELKVFLPPNVKDPLLQRSAVSSTLVAALELVRDGKADIRQDGGHFSAIFVKPANRPPAND